MLFSLPTAIWGAQRRVLDLAPQLAARGVEITLASPPESPFVREWVSSTDLPYLPVEMTMHTGLRRRDGSGRRATPAHVAGELRAIARSVRNLVPVARRADLVLSSDLFGYLETVVAARLARRPVALEVVDLVNPGIGRALLRLTAGMATAAIGNSSATVAMLDGVRSPVHLVHPGVDLDRFALGPPDPAVRAGLGGVPDAPLVGIVGRIDPKKGVHVLVSAMAGLSGAAGKARLVVVGEAGTSPKAAEYTAEVRRNAERLLGERVCFAGRRHDVPDVLRSLDVLVNASDAEPFGLSVLEAQACGVPVVATAAGGIPDFVSDGETGLLVRPFDVGQLVGALDRVLGDSDLRHRLAAAGRRQAEERFGMADQYDTIAELYRSLASRGRPRAATTVGTPPS